MAATQTTNYTGWTINVVDDSTALGFTNDDGLNHEASTDRYYRLLSAELEAKFPGADVTVRQGGSTITVTSADGDVSDDGDFSNEANVVARDVEDTIQSVFTDSDWAVDAK